MKRVLLTIFGGFKGLLFLLLLFVGLLLHLYTQRIVTQLRDESRTIVQFSAEIVGRVAETESSDDLTFLFDQVIQKINFPLIQTDMDRKPSGWKGIGIDQNDRSEAAFLKVNKILEQMEKNVDPVVIRYEETPLGYLYYGDSQLIWQLRLLPYLQVGILALFIILGLAGSAQSRQSEMRYIWVGMAKETAHQLGTPISSLMGWVEILKSGQVDKSCDIHLEMEKDLKRLNLVTSRFSKIGSKPNLKEEALVPVLQNVCEYIRRRAPQSGKTVTIEELYEIEPNVRLNEELFQWAVENMMKNSLDAMDKSEGIIRLRVFREKEKYIIIEIEDNGRGMEDSQKNKVFKPGYSTKKRGWGLGLSLARRIIQEYHNGKLFVKEARPGNGIVMRFELKN